MVKLNMILNNEITNGLQSAMRNAGILPPNQITTDEIIRFSDNGKRNNKDGWYILFINHDGSAGAAFGNWKGVYQKWFYTPDGKPLSKAQKKEINKKLYETKQKIEQEQKVRWEKASKKASGIWERAEPATPEHPYLIKKKWPLTV